MTGSFKYPITVNCPIATLHSSAKNSSLRTNDVKLRIEQMHSADLKFEITPEKYDTN